MPQNNSLKFHALALLVAFIWGSTFVVSKMLLNAGLTPALIMCLRFTIAYLVMLPFCHRHILARSWRDELLFLFIGLAGGSLYFLAENSSIKLASSSSTPALIITATPILTALLMRVIYPTEKLSARFIIGSLIALLGVAFVIFNGVFILDDNPLVGILALSASLAWAFYGFLLRKLENRYSTAIITRKVFFYGVLTMLPVCFFEGSLPLLSTLIPQPSTLIPLLYLALIASLACYQLWNITCKYLGVVRASNYLYFQPVTSLLAGFVLLSERVTVLAILGCFLVIYGVYLATAKRKKNNS